eukprot:1417327-Rhodomonas_salina.3
MAPKSPVFIVGSGRFSSADMHVEVTGHIVSVSREREEGARRGNEGGGDASERASERASDKEK